MECIYKLIYLYVCACFFFFFYSQVAQFYFILLTFFMNFVIIKTFSIHSFILLNIIELFSRQRKCFWYVLQRLYLFVVTIIDWLFSCNLNSYKCLRCEPENLWFYVKRICRMLLHREKVYDVINSSLHGQNLMPNLSAGCWSIC